MKIRAGYRIALECPYPTPMLLKLSVRPERLGDLLTPDDVQASGGVPVARCADEFGNRVTRLVAPAGTTVFASDFLIADSGAPDVQNWAARQVPVGDLPPEALPFLLGSRYCETDLMSDLAWSLFAQVPEGWARVQAIVDYVHRRITFGYPHARSTRTALEGHQEQVGVCRDYAHLAVTLCRAMNIPARYCNGYLGDIGIPPVDAPMDFSAWFEVYLEGGWYTFDARHNTPRIGRVVIARGRDAADVAMTHSFGPSRLTEFAVICEEVTDAVKAPQLIAAE
ncbi:transglutaminase family protein [Phenylobacterium sp.]|uniref:transglutaminase-like domain-containing protein n=1 Tax=Phenylobacterium sp. TaxID=1871053 RepID=UPI0011FD069E|nr:transglutaminase family protein [Phenylobacterium sp.]THD57474.1 MAG: transglutaminase family protein [Phenylobacterium sp.]